MARKRSSEKKKGRTFLVEIRAGSLFLWGGGLLFLLVWIFALGILVGRGSLSGDRAVGELKEQIGKLQEVIQRDRARKIDIEEEPSESPKLAFYEKLATKKDEALGRQASRAKPPAKKQAQPVQPVQPKKRETGPPGTVESVEKPVSAASRPEKRPPPEPVSPRAEEPGVPPPVAERDGLLIKARFTVQVAATTTRSAAEEMIRRLKSKGHPAYYYDVDVKGTTYYRVRCGRFLSRTEAEQYAGLLRKKEGVDGFVSKLE
ncbi:MAG: SPOR domain-containing protein [Deltaproteobacteria bacterium]|nr:SPOR domain-containing protein [Deltaproteobacteria bacterium]